MPHIHHELLIASPAEKIFEAITTEEGLSGWWTPGTKRISDEVIRFHFGDTYFKEMKIIMLEPSKLLKWICLKGADEWIDTIISFELITGDKKSLLSLHPELQDQINQQIDLDKASVLIFQHNNWKDYTPMFSECNYTWGRFLRSLKLFCESGKGTAWPAQHL